MGVGVPVESFIVKFSRGGIFVKYVVRCLMNLSFVELAVNRYSTCPFNFAIVTI